MKNNILIITELLASIVLILVILGTASVVQTPLFLLASNVAIGIFVSIMILLLVTAILCSAYRMSGRTISSYFLTIFGIALISVGSMVVYFLPSYFYLMIQIPLEFWHMVCIFSLPVICIEAGLFTLFTELQNKKGLSLRERYLLTTAFLLYFSLAIIINFIVLNGLWAVQHQILFYRILVFFVLLLFVTVMFKKGKKV